MKCPVCHIDMIVVEYQQIELDHCVKCLGVWFDSGELELLLEKMRGKEASSVAEALFSPVAAGSDEKKRKCPLCGKKMNKATVCDEPKVLIDTCPQGQGLWFDGGELSHVIDQSARQLSCKADTRGVLSFLSDAFKASKPE